MIVLNGTGITGLAGRTAALLAAAGYPDPMADDGPPADGGTLVYYRGATRPRPRRLAGDLGGIGRGRRPWATGAVVQRGAGGRSLVVLLAGD